MLKILMIAAVLSCGAIAYGATCLLPQEMNVSSVLLKAEAIVAAFMVMYLFILHRREREKITLMIRGNI